MKKEEIHLDDWQRILLGAAPGEFLLEVLMRAENVYNLKQVDRLYVEACGLFSLFTNDGEQPGLSVLPLHHNSLSQTDWRDIQPPAEGICACQDCGNTVPAPQATGECPVCHADAWGQAVK